MQQLTSDGNSVTTVISSVWIGTDAGIVVTGTVVVADSMVVYSTNFKFYVFEQCMVISITHIRHTCILKFPSTHKHT